MKLLNKFFDFLSPLFDFVVRGYLATVFFLAGWDKLQNWSHTLKLFKTEYAVPFIAPMEAAYIATGIELIFSVLLLIGLGGRFVPLVLFIFNIVAVISYDFLMTSVGTVGLTDHIQWGLLLLMLLGHGTGKLSLDYCLCRKTPKHTVEVVE